MSHMRTPVEDKTRPHPDIVVPRIRLHISNHARSLNPLLTGCQVRVSVAIFVRQSLSRNRRKRLVYLTETDVVTPLVSTPLASLRSVSLERVVLTLLISALKAIAAAPRRANAFPVVLVAIESLIGRNLSGSVQAIRTYANATIFRWNCNEPWSKGKDLCRFLAQHQFPIFAIPEARVQDSFRLTNYVRKRRAGMNAVDVMRPKTVLYASIDLPSEYVARGVQMGKLRICIANVYSELLMPIPERDISARIREPWTPYVANDRF